VTIATIDFLARGGDQYPLSDLGFINVGITYQQMLAGYLTGPLAGSITESAYPVGGEGRITRLE
jgi:5'-nucleotidase / UDP-sugar diphosphatase